MTKTIQRSIQALLATAVLLVTVGCDVDYLPVPTPPEGTLTAEEFVIYFNTQMNENEYRVRDWALNGKVFKLRLPAIIVGDDTLTYKAGGWLKARQENLFVQCSFNDTKTVRQISNGDVVDIVGRVAEAKQTQGRIELKMEGCASREVEGQP